MRSLTILTACLAVAFAAHSETTPEPQLVLPRLIPTLQLVEFPDLATRLVREAASDTGLVRLAQVTADPAPEAVRGGAPQKSPRRAFLLSALLPGSGELWAGARGRAALFFGLEVIGWGTYVNWNGKGSDLEDDFRARADSTYNPWDYLAWRDGPNEKFSSITHAMPCSTQVAGLPQSTPVAEALRGCSGSEKQQYYELIGKYNQFVSGWKDVYEIDTGNRVTAAEVDSAENFQSSTRLSYEGDRNESNKYLKRATNVAGVLLVNHVFSAIDAARVARARNLGQDEAMIDRRTRFGVALGGAVGTTPLLMAYRPFD